jgi:hypothetical protein
LVSLLRGVLIFGTGQTQAGQDSHGAGGDLEKASHLV